MASMEEQSHAKADFLLLWDRWKTVANGYMRGRRSKQKLKPEKYRELHKELLAACRHLANNDQDKIIYQQVGTLVAPWVSLDAFGITNPHVIKNLMKQSEEISVILGQRRQIKLIRYAIPISGVLMLFVLGMIYFGNYDEGDSLTLEFRRLFRRLQFTIAQSDFLKTFSAFAVVSVVVGIWMINSVKKS